MTVTRKIYVKEKIMIRNTSFWIKPETYLTGIKVIASGEKIREVNRLIAEYRLSDKMLTKPGDWYKFRGRAVITDGKTVLSREIHWYQAANIGKVEFKLPSNKRQK